MFAKSKEDMKSPMTDPQAPALKRSANAAPSIISADVEITGNVATSSELQLDGTIKGDVTCGTLVMGNTGSLDGQVKAESVTVRGTVKGEIHARSVRLEATAVVEGDVYHETLAVEAGAKLTGRFAHGMAGSAGKADKKLAGGKDTPAFIKPAKAAE